MKSLTPGQARREVREGFPRHELHLYYIHGATPRDSSRRGLWAVFHRDRLQTPCQLLADCAHVRAPDCSRCVVKPLPGPRGENDASPTSRWASFTKPSGYVREYIVKNNGFTKGEPVMLRLYYCFYR